MEWLNTLPMEARLAINTRLLYLQACEKLERPYAAFLHGECKGLIEIRVKHKNIQYRPIACLGPGVRQITILGGAIEKGGKFEPLSICKTAQKRKILIQQAGKTHEHSFEEP